MQKNKYGRNWVIQFFYQLILGDRNILQGSVMKLLNRLQNRYFSHISRTPYRASFSCILFLTFFLPFYIFFFFFFFPFFCPLRPSYNAGKYKVHRRILAILSDPPPPPPILIRHYYAGLARVEGAFYLRRSHWKYFHRNNLNNGYRFFRSCEREEKPCN